MSSAKRLAMPIGLLDHGVDLRVVLGGRHAAGADRAEAMDHIDDDQPDIALERAVGLKLDRQLGLEILDQRRVGRHSLLRQRDCIGFL